MSRPFHPIGPPASGWRGYGRPGFQCEAQAWEAAARLHLAEVRIRADMTRTRLHKGFYIAPDVPAKVACDVALALETIAMEGRK